MYIYAILYIERNRERGGGWERKNFGCNYTENKNELLSFHYKMSPSD